MGATASLSSHLSQLQLYNGFSFRAYEHAVLAAGTDFRSDRLWEMYINWENEQGNLREVTSIYDRILGIPTQLYSHHFQR